MSTSRRRRPVPAGNQIPDEGTLRPMWLKPPAKVRTERLSWDEVLRRAKEREAGNEPSPQPAAGGQAARTGGGRGAVAAEERVASPMEGSVPHPPRRRRRRRRRPSAGADGANGSAERGDTLLAVTPATGGVTSAEGAEGHDPDPDPHGRPGGGRRRRRRRSAPGDGMTAGEGEAAAGRSDAAVQVRNGPFATRGASAHEDMPVTPPPARGAVRHPDAAPLAARETATGPDVQTGASAGVRHSGQGRRPAPRTGAAAVRSGEESREARGPRLGRGRHPGEGTPAGSASRQGRGLRWRGPRVPGAGEPLEPGKVRVIYRDGRELTPCDRKKAEQEVALGRAKWVGRDTIRLRYDPFRARRTRRRILERDSGVCAYCGSAGDTIDHLTPWSLGGRTTMDNCVTSCAECNFRRGNRPVVEFVRAEGLNLRRIQNQVLYRYLEMAEGRDETSQQEWADGQ